MKMNNENEDILQFTKIPDNTNYWFVRASKGARYYKDFMINNFIAVASITNLNFIHKIDISNISKKNALKLYKKYFNKYVEDTIKNDTQYQEAKTEENKKKIKSQKLSRSTTLSRINYSFINEMKTGDIIIVPGKSAAKFLIGIIVSDCFDNKINHKLIPNKYEKQSYEECYFKLKRRVYWIKEITNNEFPDKMYSITNTHQSVLNILNYADNINPLISSYYIYKGNCFMRVGVKTKKNVSSDDLYYLQKIAHEVTVKENVIINQKTKIQSPGDIEFIINLSQHHPFISIIFLTATLFGEIKIPHILEFKGIIPKITNWYYSLKKNKLDLEKEKEEIKQKQIETQIKQEELRRERIKTKEIENDRNDILDKFNNNELKMIKDLNLTTKSVGNEIPVEKQMENLKSYMDKHEKK